MAEPNLIEQERRVIREFLQTAISRAAAEAKISADFDQEEQKLRLALDRSRQNAQQEINEVQELLGEAQSLLNQRGLRILPTATMSVSDVELSGINPDPGFYFARVVSSLTTIKQLVSTGTNTLLLAVGLTCIVIGLCCSLQSLSFVGNINTSIVGLIGLSTSALLIGLALFLFNRAGGGSKDSRIRQEYKVLANAAFAHARLRQQSLAQAEKEFQQQTADLQQKRQVDLVNLQQTFRPKLLEHSGDSLLIGHQANKVSPRWAAQEWASWSASSGVPAVTRMGDLGLSAYEVTLSFPALYAFPNDRSLLFKVRGDAKALATQGIQSLLLRLLATVPPGKLRFTFIDPIGLGQNAAPFMHLADYDPKLVAGKAWTEPRHIEQQLADLTEHIENVIQKYLRDKYATIEDYNAQAGEVAEAYRVLAVFDFPTNFSQDAARRLASIVQNGPRCGVFAMIMVDTGKPLPYGFSLDDLTRNANVIAWNGTHFVWESDEDFKHCALALDRLPGEELIDRITQTVGQAAVEASKVEVPFERIAPPTEQLWTADSRNGLRVALGPTGARKLQYLDLGNGTAQHVLVVGKTGSGKSNLLHVLITNLALNYGPDEVTLYLIDFKKGVEFKPYATHELPHARVIAIESEREFGLSTLQGLDAELKRRGDLFRAAGVDGLADYRQKTSSSLPRILLLVDEFQEFFTEDDAIAAQSAQILDRLVRQGRAFGIHVLLGSQTLAGSYTLTRSTVDQMAVRIALQCSEADSRLILADDNPAARLLSRPGEAIYNDTNGLVEGNNRFQVAWLPDEQHARYLRRISALAQARKYKPPRPQIVFEGNAPAEIEKNSLLANALSAPAPAAPARSVRAWIGEPIAIKEPTAALFRRQSGSNLLIVGQNDEAALGLMTTALVSLMAQSPISNPQSLFYILDFSAVDGLHAEFFDRLASMLGTAYPLKVGRRRQLPSVLAEIEAEVKRRMDGDSSLPAGRGVGGEGKPSIYLFVYGLQRIRDIRADEMFSSPMFGQQQPALPNVSQQFATILREGPDGGVHTLVWCDTVPNLNRALDRRTLRDFAMRVAFQMSGDDSANLVDSPAASKLGPHRALFYSEEEGKLEKFRPYGLPSEAWLAHAARQLQRQSTRK